jgi:tRNA G10  N-methylase Trm11
MMQIVEAQSIVILGRQPALGMAELESLFGSDQLLPFGSNAALLGIPTKDIAFNRLGGAIKLAKVLTTLPNNWREIEKYLLESSPEQAGYIDGKLTFGISVYGIKISQKQLERTALELKKAIKQSGVSVRMVPHKTLELNSATVLHNKLAGKNGWELLVISDGKTCYLAQTTNVQNIDEYAARDQARPMRDAKVGMLPPKLAQIIVNLAAGKTKPADESVILDPFCGTGVVLQEASLMGYGVSGSDIDPRMVQYSIDNMQWLRNKYPESAGYMRIEIADATKQTWIPKPAMIAGETYLGQPLMSLPNGEHLSKIIYEANLINHRFILNIAKQLPRGTRLCLGVPAWRGKHEFLHLPLLDHLTDMGYTRVRFTHVDDNDLIYHRENQIVARELLVLTKS